MFKVALAPVLSQQTNFNENMSSILLDGHDEPDEDGETVPAKRTDMDADLFALLASASKDDNNEAMPGGDLLKKLAQQLTVSQRTSSPLREGLAAILIIFCQKRWGTRSSRPNLKNILVLRMSRVCEHRK